MTPDTIPAPTASAPNALRATKRSVAQQWRSLVTRGQEALAGGKGRLRFGELPNAVRSMLNPFLLAGRNHFHRANRLNAGDHILYHIGLRRDDGVDLHLLFGEHGEILRRAEEADF